MEDLVVPEEQIATKEVEGIEEVVEKHGEEDEEMEVEEVEEPRSECLPTIAEPNDEASESESDVPIVKLPTDCANSPDPITPPQATHLGVAWNANEAKTPISALLSSIQQGFEFSPVSPLSPPMGYANHPVEPVTLF